MNDTETIRLKGEGDIRTRIDRRVRITCEECGELAVYKHSFLLEGMRSNPASSAFRKDDCSWCSDVDVFTCKECRPTLPNGCDPRSSRFEIGERFAHMFLEWVNVSENIETAIIDDEGGES